MPRLIITILFCLFFLSDHFDGLAQKLRVDGLVVDSLKNGIPGVSIYVLPDSIGTTSDRNGRYKLNLDRGIYTIRVSHINFEKQERQISVSSNVELNFSLTEKAQLLKGVQVEESAFEFQSDQQLIRINPKNLQNVTSATGDFTKVLATLPGVAANNELSSAYSVRGGNYDENLVYVNGIKIYKPQIISAGRQEGLSFVNSDMVGSIDFSAGAWRARYGDKLSSVLDVQYKTPIRHEGVINLSLLGGGVYYGGINKKQDLTFTMGVRHKNSRYLLGTLEVDGQYFPKFTDFQTFVEKRISDKTKIGFLGSVAVNNYETIPGFRETEFGTIQNSLRLNVYYEGRELLDYNTYQVGSILTHSFSRDFVSHFSVAGIYSAERENYELNGNYLLCNVNNNPGSNRFNECRTILGLGSNYSYGRNKLEAQILNVEQRNEVFINNDLLEFGVSWDHEVLDDQLSEYAFLDSADFVRNLEVREGEINISSHKLAAFGQYTWSSNDSSHIVNGGVRLNYWTYSEQLLVSPRFQYIYRFGSGKNKVLRVASGVYQQHPFYRELRNREGVLNQEVKAQSSAHLVVGFDQYFRLWNRPFKITTDLYYKYLWNVNPFDIDNVKIRYHANNYASGYAYGADFRINGEFIPGSESWFSLGYLKTEEKLTNASDYVSRPMDQRINLGMFFQDHLPNNPSMKVNLNVLFGTGLPFGPPGNDEYRNAFSGDEYARVDIGFSKIFDLVSSRKIVPDTFWIGVEILNLFAAQNTISYDWIQDVTGAQYAVPNDLSQRFFNVRMIARY